MRAVPVRGVEAGVVSVPEGTCARCGNYWSLTHDCVPKRSIPTLEEIAAQHTRWSAQWNYSEMISELAAVAIAHGSRLDALEGASGDRLPRLPAGLTAEAQETLTRLANRAEAAERERDEARESYALMRDSQSHWRVLTTRFADERDAARAAVERLRVALDAAMRSTSLIRAHEIAAEALKETPDA